MSETWRDRLDSLPLRPPQDPGGPILVLSAHPDDEVLAIGCWLAGQRSREVVFVTATDGESSHPANEAITRDELLVRRPLELVSALAQLGFDDPEIHRLGLPDGGLHSSRAELVRGIESFVRAASLVLAPFESDGHPDHDALGQVAGELCPADTRLWRFPIWTWAWTRPGEQTWLPAARKLPGSDVGRDRKRRAIECFTTQIEPLGGDEAVVGRELLLHAVLGPEVVIV